MRKEVTKKKTGFFTGRGTEIVGSILGQVFLCASGYFRVLIVKSFSGFMRPFKICSLKYAIFSNLRGNQLNCKMSLKWA